MSIRVAFLRTRSFSFRNEESEMDLIDSLDRPELVVSMPPV